MTLPPISELVPHRGRSVLVDRAKEWDGSVLTCTTRIRDDFPYMVAGRVRAVVGIELMAQAVAAYVGLAQREDGKAPRPGYVVGVRRAAFRTPAFIAGQTLEIHARLGWSEGKVATFETSIAGDEGPLAEASLTVYQPDPEEISEAWRGARS